MKRRGSGILLHIISLPSPYGIGDLGPWAYKFADFLAETKQGFWQILPLNPTNPAYGNSPYSSFSAFAANKLLISPELMVQEGLLTKRDLEPLPFFSKGGCGYDAVISYKEELFNRAYERFTKNKTDEYDYERFCLENSDWLGDFSLFVVLKEHFYGKVWNGWQREIRDREPDSLQKAKGQFKNRIDKEKFFQFIFFKQWFSLKNYCNQKGIQFIGDMPLYVNYDSTDVWANPEIFELTEEKKPLVVSGVPPDYFSQTGQLWGNPIYKWNTLRETGYRWWIQRIAHNLNLYDSVRIDHFRGFVAYWEVPAGEKTAINGRWVEAPAEDFFNVLLKRFSYLPIIAEDLGIITPEVREIMRRFKLPGMRVLLFAFGEDPSRHPYAPHNYVEECAVYTGTHDNNTVRGWFEKEATLEEKKRLFRYLGREVTADEVHWEFIRLAMMSVANLAIVPIQDILGLGEEARMNRPATLESNWRWRLLPEQLTPSLARKFREITEIYGRD
jgi:4-alpha-glucanotransferase